ncbi:MAG TPA: RNA 2',3'-cyclic phosphodiesterase [Candidatus Limnocylindria bacterium]|nr:RNA 2',3'-cyclic phosphodiesterase [Candidatus Limnocylindria bacterium]
MAVPIGPSLRADLASAVDRWRREPPADALRWADPNGWHLTLAFLGSIPADSVEAVSRAIGEVAAAHPSTRVETGRLGAFHRAGSVRTLWYGVADPDGSLATLAGDLALALGSAVEEPYRPHITLARARHRPVDLRGWIEPASLQAPSGQLEVRAVDLMRSHLSSGPARYETLASFDLGGAS